MKLFAGETKQQRKKEYMYYIHICREDLKFFEILFKKNKYNPELIKPIIKYYSDEIKSTVNNMVKLGRL